MKGVVTVVIVGILIVLVYDGSTAFLSRSSGLSYGWFSIGSFGLYALFGYLAARRSKWFVGAFAGALLGLADSTIGWAISWNMGPGKPSMEMNAVLVALTVIFAVVVAALFGLIGGAISLLNKSDA